MELRVLGEERELEDVLPVSVINDQYVFKKHDYLYLLLPLVLHALHASLEVEAWYNRAVALVAYLAVMGSLHRFLSRQMDERNRYRVDGCLPLEHRSLILASVAVGLASPLGLGAVSLGSRLLAEHRQTHLLLLALALLANCLSAWLRPLAWRLEADPKMVVLLVALVRCLGLRVPFYLAGALALGLTGYCMLYR